MSGRRRCIVVADSTFARILLAEPEAPGLELVEHSEVENCARADGAQLETSGSARPHPAEQQRAPARVNVDQQFAAALAQHIGTIVKGWPSGCVVIAAAPGTLGLLREVVQDALPSGVQLKALAKDYVSLSPPELAERLDF